MRAGYRLVFALLLGANAHPLYASDAVPFSDIRAGQAYAKAVCADCHDTRARPSAPSEVLVAPPFRAIANGPRTSAFGLNAFLQTPHATMPNIMIAEADRRNVIAYIMSLRIKDER